jgi:type I restriction enzyme S subunit
VNTGLRPYPEYRDSGVPWLGAIPAHWDIRAAKRLFFESGERARPDDIQLAATQSHGVIPQAEYERLVGRKVVRILNHLDKRKHVERDDFVISMRSFQGGLERAFARGAIRSSYVVLKPTQGVQVPYFAHLFKSHPYIQALRATSQFIRDGQDLTFGNFSKVPLPVVPNDEQEAIARYLDYNAVTVRGVIRNRRRLIDTLNEQKQAITDEVVASAVRPPASTGSSWEQRRLKYLVCNVNEQAATRRPDEVYIALEHVESWTGRLTLPAEDVQFDSQVKRFRPGDVLFGKLRPYLAKVTRPSRPGVCVGEFLVLRVSDSRLMPEFLEYMLRSKRVIDLINGSTFGAKMPRADWGFIGNVVLGFPPTHAEQAQILATFERATKSVRMAIESAKREIELVQELRTRLIADAVTGKVDVRGMTKCQALPADSTDEAVDADELNADGEIGSLDAESVEAEA